MLDSPRKYFARYAERTKKEETPAMRKGRILHKWILEPDSFAAECIISPYENYRTKEAQYWRAEMETKNVLIVSEKEREDYLKIVEAVWSDPVARPLLEGSQTELHGYAKDPETGLQLYSRPDLITSSGRIGDLKITRSAKQEKFTNQQFFDGYFIQQGFYAHVDEIINFQKQDNPFYIAVEEEYPHITQVYSVTTTYLNMAKKKITKGLKNIRDMRTLDPGMKNKQLWPGYHFEEVPLSPKYGHLTSDNDFTEFLEI